MGFLNCVIKRITQVENKDSTSACSEQNCKSKIEVTFTYSYMYFMKQTETKVFDTLDEAKNWVIGSLCNGEVVPKKIDTEPEFITFNECKIPELENLQNQNQTKKQRKQRRKTNNLLANRSAINNSKNC